MTEDHGIGLKSWLSGPKKKEVRVEPTPEKPVALDRFRVAVLPFANMSSDPEDEYFADGMTEEMISTLSRIEHAEVISRISVMLYKKAPKPISDVSRELSVGTILEGSVRKAGNKLRVTVQMIDAAKDRHLWVESYDREFKDVFAIQTEIARRVAEALQARIHKGGVRAAEPTIRVDAYAMYLRAVQLEHENTESSLREAVSLFEKIISKEPLFPRAYAGLAQSLCSLALGYDDWATSLGKAEAVARKAVELGPDLVDGHLAMARIHCYLDRFEPWTSEVEKALQINPSSAEAYRSLGMIHSAKGDLDAAVASNQRAYRLDPLAFPPGTGASLTFQLAGREREALELLERLTDLYPKNPVLYARWAEFFMIKHDFARAQEKLDTGLRLGPDLVELLADQGVLYALTNRRREAEELLHVITRSGKISEEGKRIGEVFIHAALGNLDEAFAVLMKQAETHAWPPLIKSQPIFEQMRKDPRFSIFCRKVGLPI